VRLVVIPKRIKAANGISIAWARILQVEHEEILAVTAPGPLVSLVRKSGKLFY